MEVDLHYLQCVLPWLAGAKLEHLCQGGPGLLRTGKVTPVKCKELPRDGNMLRTEFLSKIPFVPLAK